MSLHKNLRPEILFISHPRSASTSPVLLRWILDSGLHVGLRRDGVGVFYGPAAVGRAVHDLEERLAVLALALVEGYLVLGHDVRRVETARLHLARQHRMLWTQGEGFKCVNNLHVVALNLPFILELGH